MARLNNLGENADEGRYAMKTVSAIFMVVTMILCGCASKNASCADATCGGPSEPVTGVPQNVTVTDSLVAVKDAFNARADQPRVLLLVSPACSECILGAQAVRKSISDRFAASGVYAIVVWEPMVQSDNEAAARSSSAVFAGAAATQFYDPQRKTGWAFQNEQFANKWDQLDAALPADHWFRKAHQGESKPAPAPEWDLYMLYKPGVRWDERTPKPDAFIRHIGRDATGQSCYFRDGFTAGPQRGDLYQAMEQMAKETFDQGAAKKSAAVKIELLGFPGCPNTPALRANLVAALKTIGGDLGATTVAEIDQESLPPSDIRRGWPAPTVLINGKDLFDMPQPASPSPGCRVYPGRVPDATVIAQRLRSLHAQRMFSAEPTLPTASPQTAGASCTLSPEQLVARREDLIPGWLRRARQVDELPNGLRFIFASEAGLLPDIARVIEQERNCCSFLRFTLSIEPTDGPVTVEVTGPAGTGDMLRKL